MYDVLISISQTIDGGYILGGQSNSGISGDKTQDTLGGFDYWIIKTDSLGNKQWDKDFGGVESEALTSIKQTGDGGFILGGFSLSGIGGDKTQANWGGLDYWIVKTDSAGNKLWDKDFGGVMDDALYSLILCNDNGYIFGGQSKSGIGGNKTQGTWGGNDYWVIKTDSLGNKLWDRDYGGTSDEEDFGNIFQIKDGGYLIAGTSYSGIGGDKTEAGLSIEQAWILKTDSLGNKLWDKTIFSPGHIEGGYVIQTKDGCYAVATQDNGNIGGYKTQPAWNSTWDYWIVKFYDSTQTTLPFSGVSSSDTTFCEKHCIDFYDLSTNNPTSWKWFFTGADSTSSTLQNPTNICYSTYGSFDVTLIACNAAGCDTLVLPGFINEYQTLTPTITQSNDTLFSSPGIACQWWSVDSGIIAGATNYYYVPTQGGSYYVMVTDTNGCDGASNTIIITGIQNPTIDQRPLTIVPNPNEGSFTITLNQPLKDFSLRIINAMGLTIYNRQEAIVNGQWSMVNLPNVAKGLYTLELITNEKVYRQKFVIATLPK